MKKILFFFLIAALLLAFLIYPKDTGGSSCGDLCPSLGEHYYEKDCLGFKKIVKNSVYNFDEIVENIGNPNYSYDPGYSVKCYGLTIGKKRCYGVPYIEFNGTYSNFVDVELDCDYPCNDEAIRNLCNDHESLVFNEITLNCSGTTKVCNWND